MTDIDPSKVKAGDTVTLVKGNAKIEDEADRYYPEHPTSPSPHATITLATTPGAFPLSGPHAWTVTDHQPAEPEPEWKPGTVGTATVRGVFDVRVMRVEGRDNTENRHRPGVYVWRSATLVAGGELHTQEDVTDFVPDDAESLRRELRHLRVKVEGYEFGEKADVVLLRREVERLRATRKPPMREQVARAFWKHAPDGAISGLADTEAIDRVLDVFEQGGAS